LDLGRIKLTLSKREFFEREKRIKNLWKTIPSKSTKGEAIHSRAGFAIRVWGLEKKKGK